MDEFVRMVRDAHFDPGSRKLAQLMRKMATDPDFPLSEIPDRYREPGAILDQKPAGVFEVEEPGPVLNPIPEQTVRVVGDPKVTGAAVADSAPDDNPPLINGMTFLD